MGTLFSFGVMVHAPSRETMKKTLDQLILPPFGNFEVRNFDEEIENGLVRNDTARNS